MKKLFQHGALLALSVASYVSTHAAYNPAIVAADARWVVYADFHALRESTVGKELVTALSQAQSQATGGFIGLDIPKLLMTVGSLTAYGTNFTNDPNAIDGTLIAQGTADLRKIAESVLLQGTIGQPEIFAEVKDLPFPAYSVGDPAAPAGQQTRIVVAFPPEPIVIVSKSKAQLLKAREVFRGSVPSLARTNNSPLNKSGAVATGAYLFATTAVPSEPVFPEKTTQARLLTLTNYVALALGERGPDTFAHVELLASSEANAEKLSKILQGLTAVLSMAESNDQQLSNFLKATAVAQEKDKVTLRLAYPSDRLVQMAQGLQAKAGARASASRPAAPRPQPITMGKTLAEWNAEPAAAGGATVALRTVENVSLSNGMLITVGRANNGGKDARIERVEILPADGVGAPLIYQLDFMRGVGGRGTMWQFPFPGANGAYTLKVGYVSDAEGKATFALSTADPKAQPAPPTNSKGPLIPQPKF